ncbi:MAG: hypothetical protein QOK37_3990 [Thermoanaerobaculia bacterium]|jgi:hypothetical protein|nr:hypothetical protein [Thermoanaerobaculia bacterium]
MATRDRPIYRAIFVFVVAPIGAAVAVSALLLFGVTPRYVFFPGFLVKSWIKVPNAVGVLATLFVWWLVIVAIGLLWERRRHGHRSSLPADHQR